MARMPEPPDDAGSRKGARCGKNQKKKSLRIGECFRLEKGKSDLSGRKKRFVKRRSLEKVFVAKRDKPIEKRRAKSDQNADKRKKNKLSPGLGADSVARKKEFE
jgi:hypothetical protein